MSYHSSIITYTPNDSNVNYISTYDDLQGNTKIMYNYQAIPFPTPLVLIERENLYYNQYWGNSDKIILNGYTYGNGCSPFNEIISGQENILNIFSSNFNNFQIFEPALTQPKTFTIQSELYKLSKFTVTENINQLGRALSMDTDCNLLLMSDTDKNDNTGVLYLFYRENNNFSSSAEIKGIISSERFGGAIDINSGANILAVGSRANENTGQVYIFTGNKINWELKSIITGDINSKFFGRSISLNSSGNVLAVGCPANNEFAEGAGAVFIYTGNATTTNWILKNKILGDSISGQFGHYVSLSADGNSLTASAVTANLGSGKAIVITGNGINWATGTELFETNINKSGFGEVAEINSEGNLVVIGASRSNNSSGIVHIFTGNGNNWLQTKNISGSKEEGYFGRRVSLNESGNIIYIGSLEDKIYVYTGENNNWINTSFINVDNQGGIINSIICNNIGNKILIQNFYNTVGSVYFYEQDKFYEKIYENSGIIVRSINFNESNYAGAVDYTIELNSTRVSGNVIDPTNEFQFTENENKTISLSHSVSAKGINTNLNPNKSNALDNAISFVRANTGLANVPSMQFISGNINKFYLQNFSESIDRLNAIYSVQEAYTNNYLDSSLSGNLTYSIDINSGSESNSLEISIRGQYKGQKDGNINDLRNSLNVTGLITGVYNGYYNPIPLQYNITENTGENSINFDYSFDNINLPNPYYKYDSNISRDELEQIYNIQVRGDIIARGNRDHRYSLSLGNIINLTGQFISIASGILTGFKNFNSDSIISSLRLLSVNIEENPNDGTISANASYDDKFMPTGEAVDASYNISVEAPRWYMNNQATCNVKGFHIINDFDITTLPKISASTSLKYKNITGVNNENVIRLEIKNITKNIVPTNYNFNTKLQDSESYTKKYNNINSITEISYNLDKIDLSNENGLLPKFNTI